MTQFKWSVLVLIVLINGIHLVYCELKLVHVLFRHGEKSPDSYSGYPTDPYSNFSYKPFGAGQLSNAGKRRAYMIGKALRTRYNTFLGSTYSPDVLEAICTDLVRTKMSLLLVLAALYPPYNTELEWNEELNWQPIVYNYSPFKNDKLLSPPFLHCKNYIQQHKEYSNSPIVYEITRKYAELFEYLSNHTEMTVNSLTHLSELYMHLQAQSHWGLKIPSWTMPVFPKFMEKAAIDHYIVGSGTTKLIQLSGGLLLKQIMENMERKISRELKPQDRKLFLFSAHEYNVVSLLSAMEIFFPHVPPCGSFVLIELHEINNIYGVKVFYQDYSSLKPNILQVPGCSEFCPLDHFVKILEKNLPIGEDVCGKLTDHVGEDWSIQQINNGI